MKKIIVQVFIFLLLTSHLKNLNAQWQLCNGPYGGTITCMTNKNGKLFGGTVGLGVMVSTNDGSSWVQKSNGLDDFYSRRIYTAVSNGNDIFVGTLGLGVYYSTNDGENWQKFFSLPSWFGAKGIAFRGNEVFVASGGGNETAGVYYSPDYGVTWKSIHDSLPWTYTINAIAVIDENVFVGIADVGVFKSTNVGQSWTNVSNGLNSYFINTFLTDGQSLYVCTRSGIHKTTNYGQNWSAINSGIQNLNVISVSKNGTNLYAGTELNGVYRSSNNGVSWTATSLTNARVMGLVHNGTKLFAGTEYKGIFASVNAGLSWSDVSTGFQQVTPYALANDGVNIYTGIFDKGLYKSLNNGNNWTKLNTDLPTNYIADLIIKENKFYAATNAGVFVSTNSGTNWSARNNGLDNLTMSAMIVTDTLLYAGTSYFNSGVYTSTNGGVQWTNIWPQILFTDYEITALGIQGSTIFAGARGKLTGGIYKTTNFGGTWNKVNNRFAVSFLNSGDNIIAGTLSGGILMSSNSGLNWFQVHNSNYVYSLTCSGTRIFAGSYSDGIFMSTNGGFNWTNYNDSLNFGRTLSLMVANDHIFAGLESYGILRKNLTITGINHQTILIKNIELFQNFPNPFNPKTIIRYQLNKTSSVKLIVYDVTGKEVSLLVNKIQPQGSYASEFSGNDLPGGVYFYKLIAEEYEEVRKMVIVK